ncbi:uncharacterized protein LOC107878455 [Capsicum annuum]|uniref:uncharacterized protein LOC107878455 n=1 Tax=Capsicum annuum TaxID=4072 RepID=UPI001FB196EF|nr:uncharacterized protein LOC107878455 [Capsicum annuum]
MEIVASYLVSFLFAIILVIYAWRLLDWVWFRPRKLDKCLRKQGLKGNSYKLIFGDLKELSKSFEVAKSKPFNVSDDDISPRILPYFVESIKKHGRGGRRGFEVGITIFLSQKLGPKKERGGVESPSKAAKKGIIFYIGCSIKELVKFAREKDKLNDIVGNTAQVSFSQGESPSHIEESSFPTSKFGMQVIKEKMKVNKFWRPLKHGEAQVLPKRSTSLDTKNRRQSRLGSWTAMSRKDNLRLTEVDLLARVRTKAIKDPGDDTIFIEGLDTIFPLLVNGSGMKEFGVLIPLYKSVNSRFKHPEIRFILEKGLVVLKKLLLKGSSLLFKVQGDISEVRTNREALAY